MASQADAVLPVDMAHKSELNAAISAAPAPWRRSCGAVELCPA